MDVKRTTRKEGHVKKEGAIHQKVPQQTTPRIQKREKKKSKETKGGSYGPNGNVILRTGLAGDRASVLL